MGNQQSRWKLEKMFGIRRYIHLGSSSQIEPLLGAEGRVETKYQLFTDDHNHKADIETIFKRNSVLERKVNDLTRKVNDLLSRNSKRQHAAFFSEKKYERDNKAEIEMMRRKNANLGSEIKQCEKDNKAEIERMQRKKLEEKDCCIGRQIGQWHGYGVFSHLFDITINSIRAQGYNLLNENGVPGRIKLIRRTGCWDDHFDLSN